MCDRLEPQPSVTFAFKLATKVTHDFFADGCCQQANPGGQGVLPVTIITIMFIIIQPVELIVFPTPAVVNQYLK